MRPGKLFLVFSASIILIIGLAFFYDTIYIEGRAFDNQIKHHLGIVSESRSDRINDLFLEMENDIMVLGDFKGSKDILSQNYTSSRFAVKLNIDKHSSVISREIENYLEGHKYMTLEELKESSEFQSVAIRPIGKTGYTVLVSKETFEAEFHKNPDLVGLDYDLVGEEGDQGVSIMRMAKETGLDNSGFYNWTDPDGEVREKYAHFSVIQWKTSDDVEFILATTAYLEDYRVAEDVPENTDNYFEDFKDVHNYHNLLLISTDGHIVYMAHQMDGLGENILEQEYFREGLSENFIKVRESGEISFVGPFVRHYGESFSKISIMSPVYDGEKILGTVAIVGDMKQIIDLSADITGLWNIGEDYLVNKDALLITPLRFRHLDLLTQSIKTENLDECIRSLEKIIGGVDPSEIDREFYEFLNYRGDESLGTNIPVPKMEWCLLTEISEEEIFEILRRDRITKNTSFFLAIILLTVILSLYIRSYLDKKYILKEKRRLKLFRR